MTMLDAKWQGKALERVDPVWASIRADAAALTAKEPLMASLVYTVVLDHHTFEGALSMRLAQKLASEEMSALSLRDIIRGVYDAAPDVGEAARSDVVAVYERDPACHSYLEPLLYFKGFMALQTHRIGHWLWNHDRKELAKFLQMRMSEVFTVDIHPGARIGRGLMIDHAHGMVIGETAVVGDNVSMLHAVTLGGTGKESGDRHPKVGDDVLIGAGAKILGNIRIGEKSRIGAGSVVLQDVPRCKTVAGVPARIVGDAGCDCPSKSMDHRLQTE